MSVVLLLFAFVFPIPAFIGGLCCFAKTRRPVSCALICAVALSAIAFGIQTNSEPDIWKYLQYTKKLSDVSLPDAFSYDYGYLPILTIWFWLAAHMGSPYMMQATVAFIDFFIAFYIVFDFCQREEVDNAFCMFTAFNLVCLLPLFSSTSALRSTPSLLIGALGLYLNVVRGEKKNLFSWVLLVLPITIHTVGFVILGIRVLVALFDRYKLPIFALSVLFIPACVLIAGFVSPYLGFLGSNPVDLLFQYTEWTTGYAAEVAKNSYHQVLRLLHNAFFIVFSLDCLAFGRTSWSASSKQERALAAVAVVFVGLELGFGLFIITPSYLRFCYASAPLIAIYLAMRQSQLPKGSVKKTASEFLGSVAQPVLMLLMVGIAFLHLYNFVYYAYQEPLTATLLFGYLGIPLGGL